MTEEKFRRLVRIMETLRSEKGCPWDRVQTRETLKSFIVEEAYEVLEALDSGIPEQIKEELGDLLFQILFQAEIAKERGEFNIDDVLDSITEKMILRHPHVFGDLKIDTPEEVLQRWDEHKKREGKLKGSLMEGLPAILPALLRAMRVQERASRVGFDWQDPLEVFEKIQEEIAELKENIERSQKKAVEEEIGDLLFSIVNLSRLLGINPEEALRKTVNKFVKRFQYIEEKAKKEGLELSRMSLEDMERLWQEAKSDE